MMAAAGQRVGYVRVSAFDQNAERQLEGVTVDRTFLDKKSGKNLDREQLDAMMAFVRHGDTVIVHSMDRLARNPVIYALLANQPFPYSIERYI